MTKGKTLQDRLARSLDQANQRETEAPGTAAATAPATGRCTKLSVSLFACDVARLDAIRDYMATRGHRLSTSQAVKLALRTAVLDPGMETALEAIRSEDGRKW